jgi:hypothetical protein
MYSKIYFNEEIYHKYSEHDDWGWYVDIEKISQNEPLHIISNSNSNLKMKTKNFRKYLNKLDEITEGEKYNNEMYKINYESISLINLKNLYYSKNDEIISISLKTGLTVLLTYIVWFII